MNITDDLIENIKINFSSDKIKIFNEQKDILDE